jgi:hypothetical protein
MAAHGPKVRGDHRCLPVTVKFSKRRKAFTHFLTYICAIIGGVFTVAGLLNGLLARGSQQMKTP